MALYSHGTSHAVYVGMIAQTEDKMLTLYKANGSWMVRTEEKRIFELFGTYDLPTAFTDAADPEMVRAEIQQLNPGKKVVIKL